MDQKEHFHNNILIIHYVWPNKEYLIQISNGLESDYLVSFIMVEKLLFLNTN